MPRMVSAPPRAGPLVRDAAITFRLHDPDGAYAAVGLMQELRRPRDWTPMRMRPGSGIWSVDFPRFPVDRMEYRFRVVRDDGRDEVVCDPANPLRAGGAFGQRSVLELPGYVPPAWLGRSYPRGEALDTSVASRALKSDVQVTVWTSANGDVEEPLPAIVVHDGPEYADYSRLLDFFAHETSVGRLPAMRAVLLPPPWPRDEHYSASAAYARALVTDLLPAMEWLAPTPRGHAPVGMGASLGALAMLHAHRLRPQSFSALFLQSGSFFRQRWDRHESGFPRFRRISRFVGEVLNADDFPTPIPVRLTCGTVEENLENNRAVHGALRRQGYAARMVVNRDAHNYVAWRDTFEPNLTELLSEVWDAA